MDDRERKQQERAYKIWEDEGRVEGKDLDHWHRAGEEEDAEDVTETNRQASEEFNGDDDTPADPVTSRPPSTMAPD